MNLSDDRVRYIFDKMGERYDDINDLWYSWLFSRIHFFIVKDILCRWDANPRRVLDAGCGTGFQSFLYAASGAEVYGVDISPALIAVAENKAQYPVETGELFEPRFSFVEAYNRKIETLRQTCSTSLPVRAPEFSVQDLLDLKFSDAKFDHINCCGSVLSLLQDHRIALAEFSRVLKPGGTFLFEVEARYNLDLLWGLLDSVVGGTLGFELSVQEALRTVLTKASDSVRVEYPFGEADDPVYMSINLFTRKGLAEDLSKEDLIVERWRSIHSVTNLLPSTLLDSSRPSTWVKKVFSCLSLIEERIPFNLPSCSIVAIGKKRG